MFVRISRIFFLLLICMITDAGFLFSQKMYNKNKEKLLEIRKQIDLKNKELEKYLEKQQKLLDELKNLRSNEKNIYQKRRELYNNLERIKKQIKSAREKTELLKQTYRDMIKQISEDISVLYLSKFSSSYFYNTDELVDDIIKRNLILYKSDYARVLNKKAEVYSQNIDTLFSKKKNYSKRIEETEKKYILTKKKLNESKKELSYTSEELRKLRKEIEELNQTAEELTSLIKKIEIKSPYKKNRYNSISVIPKKSLPWPVIGKVIKKFGKEYIKELNTYIVHDGIKIKTEGSYIVKPVMDGTVIYAGEFRGFGNLVVIDHDNNLYTTYAFLSEIMVRKGEMVSVNTTIGKTGEDLRDTKHRYNNVLYFEIRYKDVPLDPLKYLK